MSDWNVNDLALCVNRGPWLDPLGNVFEGPAYGDLLIVQGIQTICCKQHVFLLFERHPHAYYHDNFRKVPPLDDDVERQDAALLGAGLEPVDA